MTTSARTSSFTALALLALAGGCTVGPDYKSRETAMPEAWASPLGGGETAQAANLATWWTNLSDPQLTSLVDRAVDGNLDLAEASARVREARALRGIAAADGLPKIDATGRYNRSRRSENVGGGNNNDAFREDDGGADLYTAGFDATWEIDVFGGIRRGVEAADADIGAAVESRRDVLVSLAAEVARNYTELRAFQSRLAIAQENVRAQNDTLTVTRARSAAGLTSDLDTARAESNLATTQAAIPPFESGIRASIYRLAVLVGVQPGQLVNELTPTAQIPRSPDTVPVGMPSELLRRRPDVRKAERDIAAATARIGVATADLFPKFSLTGQFGLSSAQIGNLTEGNSRYWLIGPDVRWPIFQGGRIRSNIEVQTAREQQAAARYEKAVLTSLQDVETALVNFSREQDRRVRLREAVTANQRAVDISQSLYGKGLTDFQSVLDSQRQLFQTQDALVVSERDVTQNLIALYKALGGGWESELQAAQATIQNPAPTP